MLLWILASKKVPKDPPRCVSTDGGGPTVHQVCFAPRFGRESDAAPEPKTISHPSSFDSAARAVTHTMQYHCRARKPQLLPFASLTGCWRNLSLYRAVPLSNCIETLFRRFCVSGIGSTTRPTRTSRTRSSSFSSLSAAGPSPTGTRTFTVMAVLGLPAARGSSVQGQRWVSSTILIHFQGHLI